MGEAVPCSAVYAEQNENLQSPVRVQSTSLTPGPHPHIPEKPDVRAVERIRGEEEGKAGWEALDRQM